MNRLKQIFILLFCLILLMSSSGISIFVHKCTMANTTTYSFKKLSQSDCCVHQSNEKEEKELVNKNCCEHNFLFFKVNTLVELFTYEKIILLATNTNTFLQNQLTIQTIENTKFTHHKIPILPYFGRFLIHFLQCDKIPQMG